jgi:hypothetical protein
MIEFSGLFILPIKVLVLSNPGGSVCALDFVY